MDRIGIIGFGVVGKAAANTLERNYEIVKYDKYLTLDSFINLLECKFIFVMVPTPFDCDKKEVDLSSVKESLDKLKDLGYKGVVILKSTIPPGTCKSYSEIYNFEIVFNPEFLRESTTPNEDFKNQKTVVIGTPSKNIFDEVKAMFGKVLLPDAQYYHTSTEEAEMIKTAQNTMLASRVALANMIYDACLENGVDYDKVREIAFNNFKILGPHMTQVPGPDGHRGFGGKCLPKDIRAFSTVFSSDLLNEIIKYNDGLRSDLNLFLKNYDR